MGVAGSGHVGYVARPSLRLRQGCGTTLHSDAYRDINNSLEQDERGFIAEDREAICGLQGDRKFWGSKGLSFGVEGGNGALVALGQCRALAGSATTTGTVTLTWECGTASWLAATKGATTTSAPLSPA